MRLPPIKLRWSFLGTILATTSLVSSVIVLNQQYEGSWGGFLIFLINLPISVAPLVLGNLLGLNQVPLIICAGIAQWYFIGWLIELTIKRINSKKSQ